MRYFGWDDGSSPNGLANSIQLQIAPFQLSPLSSSQAYTMASPFADMNHPGPQQEGLPGGDTIPATVSTTATLSLGGSAIGFVDTPGDHDWYKVTLTAGQTYVFTEQGSGGTPLQDSYLELYDANGILMGFD